MGSRQCCGFLNSADLGRGGGVMARVVAVHGIGQQVFGPEVLKSRWLPGIQDGIALAGGPSVVESDLAVAFYGDLFRHKGHQSSRRTEIRRRRC